MGSNLTALWGGGDLIGGGGGDLIMWVVEAIKEWLGKPGDGRSKGSMPDITPPR